VREEMPSLSTGVTTDPAMGIGEVLKSLPHRYPMVMIDRVLEIEPGKRIRGIKNVTVNEPYFPGHFPDQPVMPGVLILEALAQISGLLHLASTKAWGRKAFFMAADKVKFRKPVVPGDRLILEAEILRMKGKILKTSTRATVEGELVSEAEILLSLID